MSTRDPNLPYGGTTSERLRSFAVTDDTRERVSALAERYWEISAYVLLVVSAIVLRFWNLGERAHHHDESLHAFYSWEFSEGLKDFFTFGTSNQIYNYEHVPFMHGPFQFIGNGFVMWIFGDGDYQSRLLAAVMGTAMVGMPWLLRKQLGTFGALATAAFIAFSPTLIYYSRFTREDIYTAFWTLGIVIFCWRYITSRQERWLYLTAGFMAGSFLTKETTYMTIVAFLFFFNLMFAMHLAGRIREQRPEIDTLRYGLLVAALTPIAWAIAIAWPFIITRRTKYGLEEDDLPAEAVLLVVLGTLAAPLYAAILQELAIFFPEHAVGAACADASNGLSWRNCTGFADKHIAKPEETFAYVSIFGLIAAGTATGLMWRPRIWAIAAVCFWTPYVLLSTTFFSNPGGFFSVIWGSLDYWVSQQHERRGDQPDYYYFVTIPVYEFLPLALSLAAGLYYLVRNRMSQAMFVGAGALAIVVLLLLPSDPTVLACHEQTCKESAKVGVSITHVILPFLIVLAGVLMFPLDRLTRFLMFWLVLTAFGLTVAGEKMPWLNVHIALPLTLLAGKFVGDLLTKNDLRDDLPKLERLAPFLYAAIASGLAILVFAMVGPFSAASFGAWALVAVAGVSVYWALTSYSRQTALQVALVGAVAAFAVFSLRAGVLASWGHPDSPYVEQASASGGPNYSATRDHGDVPVELLVYTQTSGDIPVLRDRIADYARTTGQGNQLPIVVDDTDGFTWPWAWYLRDYKKVNYAKVDANWTPQPTGTQLPVLLFATANKDIDLRGQYEPGIPYHHRRWFPEEYRGDNGMYSSRDFFRDIFSPGTWGEWIDFWVRRTLPDGANEPGTVQGVAFFPVGSGTVSTEPKGPTVRTEGSQIIMGGEGFAQGELTAPSDVALDDEGNIYVADTGNKRIAKYDASGVILAVAGGFGSTGYDFNDPWSLTVADDGTVYVADTWNHRIVKLDADLKQVMTWGSGCTTVPDCDEFEYFGPRDITLSPDGNVLVSDTGNSRILEYTPDGEFVRQFGERPSEECKASGQCQPLELNEPVGIVTDAAGTMYIGDFWNKRIVVLGADLQPQRTIDVPAWGSTAVSERAYMALLDDGRLLVTDPTNGKVLVLGADGQQQAAYDVPKNGNATFARPIGIASDGTSVIVADSAGHVVRKIPLAEIAAPGP